MTPDILTPVHAQVIITDEAERLPPDVRLLIDPRQPLPANVRFFEKRVTARGGEWSVGAGFGIVMLGIILIVSGFVWIVLLVLGLVFLGVGGWIMYRGRKQMVALQTQKAGRSLRYGISLIDDRLVEHNEFGTTVIPRSQIPLIEKDTIYYLVNDKRKSIRLPNQVLGGSTQAMRDEIQTWYSNKQPNL